MYVKNKVIVAVVLIVLILLIVGGYFGIKFISDKASSTTQKYNDDVNALNVKYEEFVLLIGNYNEIRNTIKEYREQAAYYELYGNIAEEMYNIYVEYDELMNWIIEVVTELDGICMRTFNDDILNAKCTSYSEIVNTAVNVYKEDVKAYNELVENYNEWVLNSERSVLVLASKFIPTKININE